MNIFKSSLIYLIADALKALIPFLLLPIITKHLTPTEYGYFSTFQILLTIMIIFISININASINVNFNKFKSSFSAFIFSSLLIVLINTIICFCCIYFLYSKNNIILFSKEILYYILCIAFFQTIILARNTIYQMNKKPIFYGIFQVVYILTAYAMSLYFIVYKNYKWEGMIYGFFISSCFLAICALFSLFQKYKPTIKKSYIIEIYSFGASLLPHALGLWIMTGIDRIFLNYMVGVKETGLYSVSYQIGMVIALVTQAINKAWIPFLFEKLSQKDNLNKIKLVKNSYYLMIFIFLISFIFIIFSKLVILYLLDNKYITSLKYNIWIIYSYVFNGFYLVIVNYIFFEKKVKILSIITFGTAITNIILTYILIKNNGAVGAAQATMYSYILSFFVTWYISNKIYPMPWLYFLKN